MFLSNNAALFATLFVLTADSIPVFNVEPHCRTIVKRTGMSQDLNVCMQQEPACTSGHGATLAPADEGYSLADALGGTIFFILFFGAIGAVAMWVDGLGCK